MRNHQEKTMNQLNQLLRQTLAVGILTLTSSMVMASGTSTILDAIETEKNTMNQVVDRYQQIGHDFERGNQMEQALIQRLELDPNADILLAGQQMIEKKLSGISAAISEVDNLFDSSERMSVLLGQLMRETQGQSLDLTAGEKRANYEAAAQQASGSFQTIQYLLSALPNTHDYQRSEMQNSLDVANGALQKFHGGDENVNLGEALLGLQKVFGSLSTKLLAERQNLKDLSNYYLQLNYTLTAVETEDKLTTLIAGLQKVMNGVGSYSQREGAMHFRGLLLRNRSRNSLTSSGSDYSSAQVIADRIDAGNF